MNGRPPRFATWLLEHSATGPKSEALLGDLVEQFQRGRSSGWYVRQAICAIGGSFAAQVWAYKWLALGVVALDQLLPYVYMYLISHWVVVIDMAWYPRLINWLIKMELDGVRHAAYRLHLWAWTGTAVWCALLALIASVLVHCYPRQRGMVLTVFLLSNVGQCVRYLPVALADWLHEPSNPIWFFNLLWFSMFMFIATPFSILFGGTCGPRADGDSRRPNAVQS
jgi:hypothetical protein